MIQPSPGKLHSTEGISTLIDITNQVNAVGLIVAAIGGEKASILPLSGLVVV